MGKGLLSSNGLTPRLYQESIFNTAASANTLVVLPTGLGKTHIAAMLAAHRAEKHKGKVLFMAPTRPLVEQHCTTWKKEFDLAEDNFKVFTGQLLPGKREQEYKDADFIFATPQVIQNDLITKKVNLNDFVLVIFDEAHRAVGEYPYPFIAKRYVETADNPRILALTASPGSDRQTVEGICNSLFIEKVEARDREDAEVRQYVKKRTFKHIEVELPKEFTRVKSLLESVLKSYLRYLKKGGIISSDALTALRKRDILMLQGKLGSEAGQNKDLYPYLSALAGVLKAYHAQELLETQGITPLNSYFEKMRSDNTKAAKNLLVNPEFKEAMWQTGLLLKGGVEHPKIDKLLEILDKNEKNIIFAHYRASVENIMNLLKAEDISAVKLIGQAEGKTGKGVSQKEQIKRLDKFRAGEYSVLVATSVGEEGLDIPSVDHIIFYESVPSAIRSIQRAGRTARHAPGRISMLITKGTRDEAYYWAAKRKEQRMKTVLSGFKERQVSNQKTLDKFSKKDDKIPIIFADSREGGSGLLKHLSENGVEVRMKSLQVADFQISERCGVERKQVDDFLQSLIDGRLMKQAGALSRVFERPVIVVEGDSLHGKRNIHPNAIRGALASLAVDFKIPLVYTRDVEDTANFLKVLAGREQFDDKQEVALRTEKRPVLLKEQQQFMIESLPQVGPSLAKRLLEEFNSVEKVVNASESDLKKIEKIGDKKAREIRKVISGDYRK
jgi:Fanconi anemia group M protein|tara:strand:+ start:29207 stop:31384 length:2178 start_codon:yes stop_codon:yes gene_type:complete